MTDNQAETLIRALSELSAQMSDARRAQRRIEDALKRLGDDVATLTGRPAQIARAA